MDVLWGYSLQGRVWIFVGFQWVLIFCQFIAQAIIPDIPEDVEIQTKRMEFFKNKVIEYVEDEDFSHGDGDEEYDVTDEPSAHCCSVNRTRTKKIQDSLPHVPALTYPRSAPTDAWPGALNSRDQRVVTSNANVGVPSVLPNQAVVHSNASTQDIPAINQYASPSAAVPVNALAENRMTSNPASDYV